MNRTKFQTLVEIPAYPWQTAYPKTNMFMGSCFTENVGNKMADLNFDTDINPFGILYNPASICNGLNILLDKNSLHQSDLIEQNGLWHSFFHHGKFSFSDRKHTLDAINSRIEFSSQYLKTADFLFITFGTSWIYKFKKTGKTVANCHKIPANEFERFRLKVDEIVHDFKNTLSSLWQINPQIKVVFTVSPIRHWKDGAIENQRSKSVLLLAIDEIIKETGNKCTYFPSYEIVMDELRDYRFYTEDMLHISEVAVNHIWNIFEEVLIDDESCKIAGKVRKIKSALNHKPFNKFTVEHLNFLKKQFSNTLKLEHNFPFVNLENEKQFFLDRINETSMFLSGDNN